VTSTTPLTTGQDDQPRFFTDEQRAVVAAMMARIIPTDEDPGATEAGAIDFVDRYLSGVDYIYAKPDGSGFRRLEGKKLDAWTYRIETLREKYRSGIALTERVSEEMFGAGFASLSPEEQDQVLVHLERHGSGEKSPVDEPREDISGSSIEIELQMSRADIDFDFLPLVITHTRQGFYADPIYGGNRDKVGWKLIGFPGPDSLAEVHSGRFSTLAWFAENLTHPGEEASSNGE
jgi:gluconate 2-dehydrogenase gamma chain